jgi:hypothetical protein
MTNQKLTFYVDESGPDSNSSVAVVGGLLLDDPGFFWLDVEWAKILSRYGIEKPVHMRAFAPNGHFKDISHAVRRGLFGELVKQLTPTGFSALPRPSPQIQYRQVFRGLSNLSMYGACFVQLVMMNGTSSSGIGYHRAIPYVLDDGNSYKDHIMQAHSLLSAAAENNMGQSSFVATLQFVFCKPRT